MGVGKSAFYDWLKHRHAKKEKVVELKLAILMRHLFIESRHSLGSRQMMKRLQKEGHAIGRFKTRRMMRALGLVIKRRHRYIHTTDSKHQDPVADNVLNRAFKPQAKNQVWTTDITYLWTNQGWIYLAVVIDLYSRRVVGWHIDSQMNTALVMRALIMAIALRSPPKGLIHHSDRGAQYTSYAYQQLLAQSGMICSMSRKGNCWDNAPTERFFGSLKREWTTGMNYQSRKACIQDIKQYIDYYNSIRLHSTINDMTPIEFEKCA